MKNQAATKQELDRALYSHVGKSRLDLESQLLKSVMEFCAVYRIPCFRRNVGAMAYRDNRQKRRMVRFGEAGQADLWFIGRNGVHGECELKAPGKRPTPEQAAWLKQMRDAGCIAFWADSLDGFIAHMRLAGLL